MAPVTLERLAIRTYKSSYRPHRSHSNVGAGIGGGVVAAIIALMIIIFICTFIYKYRKASRVRTETGKPIKTGKIFLDSFLIAITFGILGLCCAECVGGNENGDAPAPAQQPMADGGYVPSPMPTYQPQGQGMDWTPVNNAAQAPVQ